MKKYLFLFLISIVAFSCTDDFEDLNTDKKNPSAIPGEPLFTNATRNAFDLMLESNVNRNVFRLYSQYWAQTTYPDESQYNMVGRQIPDNMWNIMYRDVLKDLKESKTIIDAADAALESEKLAKNNKLAIIDIMEAYVYTTLVDIFGDIPFTQALDFDNTTPAYDDAKTVYYANIDKLKAALDRMTIADGSFDASADPVYNGNTEAWFKFGHSLQLKLAMRIADSDDAKARAMVADAEPNVFSSAADNFAITYFSSVPNTHPLWVDLVASGRNDFVGSNTFIDILNDLNDPRVGAFFKQVELDTMGTLGYLGGTYGDANAATSFSNLGDAIKVPDLPGTLMSYSEVRFLLAEAAARSFSVTGSAEEHYNAAITESMAEWGFSGAAVTDYLAQADVAYTTAPGDWKQKIGTQKWISMFNNGFEGWTTWRLLDFTGFNAPPGMTLGDIPTRFIFPINEATLNGANYSTAAAKYGNDSATAKLFWDMN